MKLRQIGFGGLLSMALAVSVSAQISQQIPLQLVLTEGQSSETIQNGGSPLSFVSPAGQSQTAQITATYSGAGQITVSQQPTLVGSTVFTAIIQGKLPLTLNPGGSFSIVLTYSPTSAAQTNAQLSLPVVETIVETTPPNVTNNYSSSLSLQGIAPAFVLSYALQTTKTVLPCSLAGTLLSLPRW